MSLTQNKIPDIYKHKKEKPWLLIFIILFIGSALVAGVSGLLPIVQPLNLFTEETAGTIEQESEFLTLLAECEAGEFRGISHDVALDIPEQSKGYRVSTTITDKIILTLNNDNSINSIKYKDTVIYSDNMLKTTISDVRISETTWIGFLIVVCIPGIPGAIFIYKRNKKQKRIRNQWVAKAEQNLTNTGFKIHKKINISPVVYETNYLLIDDSKKQIAIPMSALGHQLPDYNLYLEYKVVNFNDIIDFEISEDGNTVYKGRSGSALVGGLAFGVVGAIASAAGSKKQEEVCTSLSVEIILNNLQMPRFTIPLITKSTNKGSSIYSSAVSTANEIIATLKYIQNNQDKSE